MKRVDYVCSQCSASGVRLYRQYQTLASHVSLLCRRCAIADQHRQPDNESEHSIGWLVAAVPVGNTFWGYSSIPDEGVRWWDNLPKGLNDEPS